MYWNLIYLTWKFESKEPISCKKIWTVEDNLKKKCYNYNCNKIYYSLLVPVLNIILPVKPTVISSFSIVWIIFWKGDSLVREWKTSNVFSYDWRTNKNFQLQRKITSFTTHCTIAIVTTTAPIKILGELTFNMLPKSDSTDSDDSFLDFSTVY